jgi:hypothetical protein
MTVKICEICGKNKATVPDREKLGRLINKICQSCHVLRLKGDLKRILELQKERRKALEGNE